MTEEEDTSQDTKDRLEYLGSIIASVILIGTMALIALVAFGFASLGGIPQAWFVAIVIPVVIMSAIQVFGEDVYSVFKENSE